MKIVSSIIKVKEVNMPAAASKKEKSNGVTVVEKMRDYSNDPFFKKKEEQAREFINKHGLPKNFTSKEK